MRVVAGKYRGTNLYTLEGNNTRPTKDMVKEALFSSLMVMPDESFLDIFSGSGAIGIEAISRGLSDVIFNDYNRDACKIIEKNLDKIKVKKKVYNLDYKDLLNSLKTSFDYIFADPPYAFEHYDELFELIQKNNLLNEKGIIVLEVKSDNKLKERFGAYLLYKERKYGISKLLYYRKEENQWLKLYIQDRLILLLLDI